ncbi:hypothetical protein [Acetoanaerobium pronyense]|uniref:hypothetical protein n=1 Tax=Acetoanaerobium pronyense TaxID=1482736 RepID=UPI001AE1BC6F|nr:hypothetical protein [Acetoanaerobium pronyense]
MDNAKLDNYEYVKYYTKENKFIAEMKCLVDKFDTIFYYEFDNNNYLQKIMMYQDEKMQCMFNREKELKELKKEYLELNNIQLSKIG